MFRSNYVVLILPVILMGFIIFGGYYYLQQTEQVTNTALSNVVLFELEQQKIGNTLEVYGQWNWNEMPTDGLAGSDYIGLTFFDKTSQQKLNVNISNSKLTLLHGSEIIYETAGELLEDGIIFGFPNQLLEHESYGNVGTFSVEIEATDDPILITAAYLHTWVEHDGLIMEDSRFLEPTFREDQAVEHWVIERSIETE